MIEAIQNFFKKLMKGAIFFFISLSFVSFFLITPVNAARTSMSGDYIQDTVSVIESLKEAIDISQDQEGRTETVALITDYISRYRNRPQVNSRVSFTTMQTALNALAGHYKTFGNRPIPDQLQERLDKELSKAEVLVKRED